MGLLEYLLERKNPGKVGSIKKNNRRIEPINPVKLIVSCLFLYLLFAAYFII